MVEYTSEQRRKLDTIIEGHRHENYEVSIELTEDHVLKDFAVHSNVLRPEKVTALYLARWLFYNNGLFFGKKVLDMGSGTGIQGVVMGLYGAESVVFSDLSPAAVKNSKENVEKFSLGDKSKVLEGDLFEKVEGKFDLIVFNHPFFSDHVMEQLLIADSILDRGKLIHRFLEDAKKYLSDGGVIVMPYFKAAGPINDPIVQAPEHGYDVFEKMSVDIKSGLQIGRASVYELRLKDSDRVSDLARVPVVGDGE